MFDFSKVGSSWHMVYTVDYVAFDRFGTADLLPFTISDMDFCHCPQHYRGAESAPDARRCRRWKTMSFALRPPVFRYQHYTAIDSQTVVYGPSVTYMVSELIVSGLKQVKVGSTPAWRRIYKAIEGNQRTVMPAALEKQLMVGWRYGQVGSRVGETRM